MALRAAGRSRAGPAAAGGRARPGGPRVRHHRGRRGEGGDGGRRRAAATRRRSAASTTCAASPTATPPGATARRHGTRRCRSWPCAPPGARVPPAAVRATLAGPRLGRVELRPDPPRPRLGGRHRDRAGGAVGVGRPGLRRPGGGGRPVDAGPAQRRGRSRLAPAAGAPTDANPRRARSGRCGPPGARRRRRCARRCGGCRTATDPSVTRAPAAAAACSPPTMRSSRSPGGRCRCGDRRPLRG